MSSASEFVQRSGISVQKSKAMVIRDVPPSVFRGLLVKLRKPKVHLGSWAIKAYSPSSLSCHSSHIIFFSIIFFPNLEK